jgi:hypothetical protein
MTQVPKSKNMQHAKPIPVLAAETLRDYLLQVESEFGTIALTLIAAQAMAGAAWKTEGEIEPEEIFDTCKRFAIGDLRRKNERMHAKLSAIDVQRQAAH